MVLHFEYLPRSIRGESSWEGEALEYTVVQALAFSVSISAINRRGFSCNTLQLGVKWVGKYLDRHHRCLFVKVTGYGVLCYGGDAIMCGIKTGWQW